jgi:hypothetical protein
MKKVDSGIQQSKPTPRWRFVCVPIVTGGTFGTFVTWGTFATFVTGTAFVARCTFPTRTFLTRDIGRGVLRTRRLGYGHGKALIFRIGSRPLMRRPRTGHRLSSNSKPVHNLWPRPDRRALPRLRRVFDQFVESRVASTVSIRLDRHRLAPLWLQRRLRAGSLASRPFRRTRALVHTDEYWRVKSIYGLRSCGSGP